MFGEGLARGSERHVANVLIVLCGFLTLSSPNDRNDDLTPLGAARGTIPPTSPLRPKVRMWQMGSRGPKAKQNQRVETS